MSNTVTRIVTNSQPTWKSDSTHSSSSSAIRYQLDEEDTSPILVYDHKNADIFTSSQKDLVRSLDDDPKYQSTKKGRRYRVTKKDIPRFTSVLDIKRHDFYIGHEHDAYRTLPNYDSPLASIRLPSNIYFSRSLLGNYQKLFIISPETSPEGSLADSDESRKISPSSTFGSETSGIAEAGAERD